ncbi:hypothetical protein [Butyrivibrio sp. MC2013]|uniref:hypothetical protein n=1 Tax=Butyrivibrio sp. MC2013 TaxID=1280686 RepID=UPI000425359A|nr:hypothetical protein [Butyrivibrio sp. MC2013]
MNFDPYTGEPINAGSGDATLKTNDQAETSAQTTEPSAASAESTDTQAADMAAPAEQATQAQNNDQAPQGQDMQAQNPAYGQYYNQGQQYSQPQQGQYYNQGQQYSQPQQGQYYNQGQQYSQPQQGQYYNQGQQYSQPQQGQYYNQGQQYGQPQQGQYYNQGQQYGQPQQGQYYNQGQYTYPGQIPGAAPAGPTGPKKKKTGLIIGLVAALLLILGCGAAAAAMFLGGSANDKVLKAVMNSMPKEKVFDVPTFTEDEGFTLAYDFDMDVEGTKVGGDLTIAHKKKESSITGNVDFSGINTNMAFYMNDKELFLNVPILFDKTLSYNYVDEKTGYLSQILTRESGFALEDLDVILKTANDYDSLVKEFEKATKDAYNVLKFEKDGTGEYELMGAKTRCTAYKAELGKDELKNIIKVYKDALNKHPEIVTLAENLLGSSLDELEEDLDELTDVDSMFVTVYVSKNKAAAIVLEAPEQNEKIEILFEGKKNPGDDVIIKYDDKLLYETVIEVNGDEIKQTVKGDSGVTSVMTLNKKDGAFDIEMPSLDMVMSGTLQSDKNSLEMTIDKISADEFELEGSKISYTLTKGAKIEAIKADDKTIDIGNASEEEFNDILSGIMTSIFSIGY